MLLCLGSQSLLGLVKDEDVLKVTTQPDLQEDEPELACNWDAITLNK